MQSGAAKRDWVLVFEPQSARTPDPLMGWTTTTDMNGEVRLSFESEAEAVAYAQRHGIPFQVTEPKPRKIVVKAYADNFSAMRKTPWTH